MTPERWQQIDRLYHTALEVEGMDRIRFLEEACGGDVELRAEVESLLATHEQAGGFLGKPAMEEVAQEFRGEPSTLLGRQLGPYQVVGLIGAGGMGEVYKAKDTRLNRMVALKVLPRHLSERAELRERFEREARAIASLSHPHICALYDIGNQEGLDFLVMEYLEGETLAVRLKRGPLPLREALDTCRQIAEGLEAAHEKGVIHRDLKPGNVMLTEGDKVKILDFGLAKTLPALSDKANATAFIAKSLTESGMILGTAAYMSPEQARGKLVDKRADIWAFGCILYECLAGEPSFGGETITDTLAAILNREPDWRALPATISWKVKDLLHRCLRKDPRERLHDIADARLEIEESLAHLLEEIASPRRFSLGSLTACATVMLLAGIIIGLVLMKYFQPLRSEPIITSTIKIEPGHWLEGMRRELEMQRPSRTAMVISSDGAFVVYNAIEENPGPQAKPRLFLQRMEQLGARPIAGTEGGINPFLSPDNRWVGFWAGGKLKKTPVDGGVATALCDASSTYGMFGASWGGDNTIVFADGAETGLLRVPADGGKPEVLTSPDPKREESSHRLPSWLPNGKAMLFTVMRHRFDTQPWLALLRLDTREWHVLLQDAADARYVPTGHLMFLRQGVLMAVRFDLARLEVIGKPSPLVENVMQAFSTNSNYNTGAGQYDISNTGSLLYAAGGILPDRKNSLVWVDQRGIEQPVAAPKFPFFAPRLSPDGQRIAYVTAAREFLIWVYDLSRGTNSQLTSEGRADYPIWTPDGNRLLFAWHQSLVQNLYWQAYDGNSPMERFTSSEHNQSPGSWSSDGKTVALAVINPDANRDIAVMDVRSGCVTPFLNSQFNEMYPEFSPDGRWIAYSSDESKRAEVYVRPFPGPGMKYQVSSEGGIQPLWARNGKQLFYRWQDQVWAVDIQTDGGFRTSMPRLLFERPGYAPGNPVRGYDLSLDGQRFLMVKLEPRKPQPVIDMILVQNWFEELKQKIPTGNK